MARTPKEMYIGLAKGEWPDYVMGNPKPEDAYSAMVSPYPLYMPPGMSFGSPRPKEYTDLWGVQYVTDEITGIGISKPNVYVLEDIVHWDRYIKKPEAPADFDWEAFTKDQLKDIDRDQKLVSLMFSPQAPFQQIMNFMGFTEGLSAMYEEPESFLELLDYLLGFYLPIVEKGVEYYKPDDLSIPDDTASRYAPFFSVDAFKKFFKPYYARLAKVMTDRGGTVTFHNCGKCEAFVPDMIDFGVKYWNPAQTDNDLETIIDNHWQQDGFVCCGGWDFVPEDYHKVTEEQIRQSVRDSIDKYAPHGGYVFGGGFLGMQANPERSAQINGWVQDEVYAYGRTFYSKKAII
ncbi:MAG: veratrol--corrinoid protein metyltransferase [Eubacteriaceae bacterium]|nr:veratrol--corrinoid protein metyltransferase [Eubacteriaceae bacterium]